MRQQGGQRRGRQQQRKGATRAGAAGHHCGNPAAWLARVGTPRLWLDPAGRCRVWWCHAAPPKRNVWAGAAEANIAGHGENVINNFCVNNSFLYNSIPPKENMFRENMFREDMFRENMFRRNMFRENMHPPRTNPRPINIEVEYSCELSRALARQWEFHEKREKIKIEKIQCPGFERGTGSSLAWRLIHSTIEVLYGLEAEKLCIYSTQQRIIRS
jgi:hypothetical protein